MNESKEMYLETILSLSQKQAQIRAIDIAKAMDFSKPTVSIALKKLKAEELINIDENNLISLTSRGLKIAEDILERHHTLTKFLTLIGVSANQAEEDACKMEHIVSNETFEKIKKLISEH